MSCGKMRKARLGQGNSYKVEEKDHKTEKKWSYVVRHLVVGSGKSVVEKGLKTFY